MSLDHERESARAVVVGSASDIGIATMTSFAERGIQGIGIDLESHGVPSGWSAVTSDIRDYRPPDSLFGQLRYVVHVAGGATQAELQAADPTDLSLEEFRAALELNLVTAWSTVRTFVPVLRQSSLDRSVTFVSSINALGGWGLPAYSASKAALDGMTRVLAPTLGREGIRINVLMLGSVDTAGVRRLGVLLGREFDPVAIGKRAILGKILSPSDVAAALVTLACESTSLTGQSIILDNGQSLSE